MIRTISAAELARFDFAPVTPEMRLPERISEQLRHIAFELAEVPFNERERRVSIDRDTRAQVWDWSDGLCFYCGKMLHPILEFEVDHAIPLSRGGQNELRNFVASCKSCNNDKRDRTVDEFRAVRGILWCDLQAARWAAFQEGWAARSAKDGKS